MLLLAVYVALCWARPFRNGRVRIGRRLHTWWADTTSDARR